MSQITISDLVHEARSRAAKYKCPWRMMGSFPYEDIHNVAIHLYKKPGSAKTVHAKCECYKLDFETWTYTKQPDHVKFTCPIELTSMGADNG